MFSDPQTVTINSVAQVMPRVSSDGRKAVYKKADDSFTLTISHQPTNNRIRSSARLDQRAVVADPLTNANDYETLSFYVVCDRPNYGFTMTQVEQIVAGFAAWLNTACVDRLFGQES